MPYKNGVKLDHSVEGLEDLHSYLLDLERQTRMKPHIIFKVTSHYQA